MTSPYLNRPARDLEQVLMQKGMTREGVGIGPAGPLGGPNARPRLVSLTRSTAKRFSYGIAATLSLCALVLAASAIALTLLGTSDQVANDPSMEEIGDIAPAAGPANGPVPASEEINHLMIDLGDSETLRPMPD